MKTALEARGDTGKWHRPAGRRTKRLYRPPCNCMIAISMFIASGRSSLCPYIRETTRAVRERYFEISPRRRSHRVDSLRKASHKQCQPQAAPATRRTASWLMKLHPTLIRRPSIRPMSSLPGFSSACGRWPRGAGFVREPVPTSSARRSSLNSGPMTWPRRPGGMPAAPRTLGPRPELAGRANPPLQLPSKRRAAPRPSRATRSSQPSTLRSPMPMTALYLDQPELTYR